MDDQQNVTNNKQSLEEKLKHRKSLQDFLNLKKQTSQNEVKTNNENQENKDTSNIIISNNNDENQIDTLGALSPENDFES